MKHNHIEHYLHTSPVKTPKFLKNIKASIDHVALNGHDKQYLMNKAFECKINKQ